MRKLCFFVLLMATATSITQASAAPVTQNTPCTQCMDNKLPQQNTTEALNAKSLAYAQSQPPPQPAIPPVLPEGTIAKGTGVRAPELPEAPVYNPNNGRY